MWALRRAAKPIRILIHRIPVRTLYIPQKQRFSPQTAVKTPENVVSLHDLNYLLEESPQPVGQLHETHETHNKDGGEIGKDERVVEPHLDDEVAKAEVKGETGLWKKRFESPLYNLVLKTPRGSMKSVLDKWVEDGNPIGREVVSEVKACLRKRELYAQALQFVEWLEENKHLDLNEHDYASHLDLVAKQYGLQKAESYIQHIPESFRGEVIYRSLLAHCVASANVKKAEEVFKKMRELGFPLTIFTCDQLLLLYKRIDRSKIVDVLGLMEKENVKPSLLSYRLLIDSKGSVNDISGMEEVVEFMKTEGVEPDLLIQSMIAKFYIRGGLKEKAEQVLKEMGGHNIKDSRNSCELLIPLYADLRKADDVMRVWKLCESNPRMNECLAAIEAFGKLGHIEGAEEVFETLAKRCCKLSSKYYEALLNVYANHKLLTKGKELAKRMSDDGCTIGPVTWDALVKLYVSAGEVEKADSILANAATKNRGKPLFNSYMAILRKYSTRGDFDKAEKIFERMQQNGYVGKASSYQLLLQAYIHAKAPAYGFRERLKADNLIPNRNMELQLVAVDPFRKTPVSELPD